MQSFFFMRYIGNILTEEPLGAIVGGVLYNIVSKEEELLPELPTLIIGWEKTKELYPEASIIEWVVADNVYWTYGKYEKRDRFEANLKNFYTLVLKKMFQNIKYVFFDIFSATDEKFQSFLNSLSSDKEKVIYASKDMLYIYYDGFNDVFGISLRDCDYINAAYKKRIFSAIYNNDAVMFIKNNDENQETLREIRYSVRGNEYILPYLFSKKS